MGFLLKIASESSKKSRRRNFLFRLFLICAAAACAASPADSTPDTIALGEVQVVTRRAPARAHRDNSLNFDAASLDLTPRTLGEADALNYLRLLPGINTSGDYSSGVAVDGMDYANNIYLLNGIPVHFPYHFGGIFSTFNSSLYPRATVLKSIRPASAPDYLGGVISVSSPRALATRTKVKINIGMLASTLSAEVPLSRRLTLAGAARASYLNIFYSNLLGGHNTKVDYNYCDADFNARWQPDDANTINATFHYNRDRLGYRQTATDMLTAMHWHNTLGGITWESNHTAYSMRHRLYHSAFANRLGMTVTEIGVLGRNSFRQTGLEGSFDIRPSASFTISPSYTLHRYRFVPQDIESRGVGAQAPRTPESTAALAEASVDLRWRHSILQFSAGSKLTYYHGAPPYRRTFADPYVGILVDRGRWSVNASIASARQYIHQVGFSEIGMASNFRIAADAQIPAQHSWNYTISGTFAPTRVISLSADVFYKSIYRQPEYSSSILELVSQDYVAQNFINSYNGHNVGASAMASFSDGSVSATASYSFCRALRKDPRNNLTFTASSEIRHSAKVFAAWTVNRHWVVNGVFNLSSGRPYTPITAVYMIGQRVMMEYGEHNSATMPLYHRLDLGAAYKFTTGGRFPLRHRIDLSILNVYAHKNVEIYTYTLNREELYFRRRDVGSLYSTLPSLSYTITF